MNGNDFILRISGDIILPYGASRSITNRSNIGHRQRYEERTGSLSNTCFLAVRCRCLCSVNICFCNQIQSKTKRFCRSLALCIRCRHCNTLALYESSNLFIQGSRSAIFVVDGFHEGVHRFGCVIVCTILGKISGWHDTIACQERLHVVRDCVIQSRLNNTIYRCVNLGNIANLQVAEYNARNAILCDSHFLSSAFYRASVIRLQLVECDASGLCRVNRVFRRS